LAPTVGIVATAFCYPGGILQLFSSTSFAAANSSIGRIDQSSASVKLIIIGKDLHPKPADKFRH
jgi:hypothetical protein